MILDGNDPSGLGVFSKTGRQLTEKIPMLAKRKVHHQPDYEYSHTQALDQTQPLQPNKSLGRKPQPFSVVVSRDKRDTSSREKLKYPVVGQYRYEVSERPHLIMDYLDVYRRAQRNHEGAIQRKRKVAVPNIQVPQHESFETTSLNRSVGHIDMSKMIGRNESFRATFKLPAQTELYQDNPEQHSVDSKMLDDERARSHKKGIIHFEKQLSREQVSQKREAGRLCYDYNYEYNRRVLGKVGPKFETLTKRRPVILPSYTATSAKYDFDEYVWKQTSRVYPNTRTGSIDFTRQTNRYRNTVIPS